MRKALRALAMEVEMERHAEKIDAQIENGHIENFGGRGHGAQDGACQGGAKHHEGKTAHKGHNGHR